MDEDGKSPSTNKPGMVARLMELKKRRQHIANGKYLEWVTTKQIPFWLKMSVWSKYRHKNLIKHLLFLR